MKAILASFLIVFVSFAAVAEEGGEEKKAPPPKPSPESPVVQVYNLPIVKQWRDHMKSTDNSDIMLWGESINLVDGHECWDVAVGKIEPNGQKYIMRRFCVPKFGGDILVESIQAKDTDDVIYTPYPKWMDTCKPTADSAGTC